jgi:hypothetical protein
VLLGAVAATAGGGPPEPESFLLPGVGVSDIDFQVGGWCRYLVVDEAMGEVDTTAFYMAVLDRETTPAGEAFWIEVETGPYDAGPEDRDVTRALVDGSIRDLALGDSLYRYVRRLYIKKGVDPVQPGDPRDLKRLTLANPTSENQWTRQTGVTVETPMGEMTCDLRELTVEESREVPTGNVTVVQKRHDRFRVWTSDRVPVLNLVRCVIDRSRESRTVPRVPGIPEAGARESRTTAVVVGYGTDARPILSLP